QENMRYWAGPGLEVGNLYPAENARTFYEGLKLPAEGDWEEIVEVSVYAPTGNLRVDALDTGPVVELPLLSSAGPGWYRVRVHAKARRTLWDKTSTEPVEDYLVQSWPADPADITFLRTTDLIDESPSAPVGLPSAPQSARKTAEEEDPELQRLLRGLPPQG
ncbi:hypothetical protein ACWC10_38055, partial [Streptomyces sp. NPDC001595]